MAQIAQYAAIALVFFLIAACGVKGDPLPPEKPADIGRGRPSYKRATEPLKQPNLPSVYEDSDDNSEDDREEAE